MATTRKTSAKPQAIKAESAQPKGADTEIKSNVEQNKMTTSPAEAFKEANELEDAFLEGLDVTQLCVYGAHHYGLNLPPSASHSKADLIAKIKAARNSPKGPAQNAKFVKDVPVGYAKVVLMYPSGSGKSTRGEFFNLNDQYMKWVKWDTEIILPIPLVRHIQSCKTIKTEVDTDKNYRETRKEVAEYPMSVLAINEDPGEEQKRQAAIEAGLEASRRRREARERRASLASAVDGLR